MQTHTIQVPAWFTGLAAIFFIVMLALVFAVFLIAFGGATTAELGRRTVETGYLS